MSNTCVVFVIGNESCSVPPDHRSGEPCEQVGPELASKQAQEEHVARLRDEAKNISAEMSNHADLAVVQMVDTYSALPRKLISRPM